MEAYGLHSRIKELDINGKLKIDNYTQRFTYSSSLSNKLEYKDDSISKKHYLSYKAINSGIDTLKVNFIYENTLGVDNFNIPEEYILEIKK